NSPWLLPSGPDQGRQGARPPPTSHPLSNGSAVERQGAAPRSGPAAPHTRRVLAGTVGSEVEFVREAGQVAQCLAPDRGEPGAERAQFPWREHVMAAVL